MDLAVSSTRFFVHVSAFPQRETARAATETKTTVATTTTTEPKTTVAYDSEFQAVVFA